jgi:hypothetical protein
LKPAQNAAGTPDAAPNPAPMTNLPANNATNP